MSEYSIDLKKMCAALKQCDESNAKPLWDTDGEEYLFKHIVPKCVFNQPLLISDIDFSAFNEDDIVNIVDNKSNLIDGAFHAVNTILESFSESSALSLNSKRFF